MLGRFHPFLGMWGPEGANSGLKGFPPAQNQHLTEEGTRQGSRRGKLVPRRTLDKKGDIDSFEERPSAPDPSSGAPEL